jgi:hypothetical protein
MSESAETKLQYALTHLYKRDLIAYMNAHAEDFPELLDLALSVRHECSWRAAWLLWSCMEVNDQRVQAHVSSIIDLLPGIDDNRQREFLIILQRLEIAEEHDAHLFEICTQIWANLKKNASLRFHAFKIMLALSRIYPEFANEIVSLTDSYYLDQLSESLKKSIMRLMMDQTL